MNDLVIRGTQTIEGKEVRVIEGGFGEGQKCMLASDIAKQHDVETKYINKIINNNIKRFNGNDLIDIKGSYQEPLNLGMTAREFANYKNIFLLSERGYTKLVAMMANDNEKKWEVMDKLIDDYFSMREALKPQLPQDYLSALKALVESEEEKQRLSLEKAKIEEEKNRLIHQGKLYTTTEIAKELGFKSAKAFNEFLKEKKIQYKVNDTWVLAARFSELGYTEIKQTELDNGKIIYNRKWTGIGRDWLINEVMKGEY